MKTQAEVEQTSKATKSSKRLLPRFAYAGRRFFYKSDLVRQCTLALKALKLDMESLRLIYERDAVVHANYRSEYQNEWIELTSQERVHELIEQNVQRQYHYRWLLNDLDPHPDFDLMYPNPSLREQTTDV